MADLLVHGQGLERFDLGFGPRELGVLLRTLHSLPVPSNGAVLSPRPTSLDRLHGWFAAVPATDSLGRARGILRRVLGVGRWERLQDWGGHVAEAEEKVIGHGWPGLGRCVPHGPSRTVEVVIGEEIALSTPSYDLGLLVGELLEMRRFLTPPQGGWESLMDSLFEGYGRSADAAVLRCAGLGILLHLHDFCVYTDGAPEHEARRRAELVAVLLERVD